MGTPLIEFMTLVAAIVFFCVVLENFAIYSTNISKEENPKELKVEKLDWTKHRFW